MKFRIQLHKIPEMTVLNLYDIQFLVPGVVRHVKAFCPVVVWEPPTLLNGVIQSYEVQFPPGVIRTVTTTFYITTEEDRSAAKTVQVREIY